MNRELELTQPTIGRHAGELEVMRRRLHPAADVELVLSGRNQDQAAVLLM